VHRRNQVEGGTVYVLPILPPGHLQFIFGDATPFQIKNFDTDKRLYLTTADGTTKTNLLLQVESMPTPVDFERGLFSVDGNVIGDPKSWASLKGSAAFDQVAKVQSLGDIMRARKAPKRR
jgi:hypothetical protein